MTVQIRGGNWGGGGGGGGEVGNQQEEEAKVFQTRPDILHSQPITSEFGESDIEQGGGGDEIE